MRYASPLYGTIPWEVLFRRDSMHTNILVVYKKNFEEVHDMALATIRQALDELVSENRVRVDYTARETVRRADFDGLSLIHI